jgi:hypothetical protein
MRAGFAVHALASDQLGDEHATYVVAVGAAPPPDVHAYGYQKTAVAISGISTNCPCVTVTAGARVVDANYVLFGLTKTRLS